MTGNFGVEQSTCHNDAVHTPSPVHANVAESLVLCLVSGSYKLGGFNEALKKVGLGCEVIDFTSDPITDLLDHHVWQTLNCRILKGDFVAVLMSPPCNTFDAANQPSASSQSPLRDSSGPGLFGRKSICPEDKQLVRHQIGLPSNQRPQGSHAYSEGFTSVF